MFNELERKEAMNNFREFMTEKTKQWKADTDIYIRNVTSLLKDDIIDIIKGQLSFIEYKSEKDKAAILTLENGNIPLEKIIKYDAMVAIAHNMGIELSYEILYLDGEAIVEFSACGEVPKNYVSEKIELTRVRAADEPSAWPKTAASISV